MADVVENATYPDATTAITQGKRHLLVQDYTAAVTALAAGLEMLSQKLGECDDELGEPYLLYGRALLGLAREEAGVLGGGVPGSEDADEDEDGEDEEGDDEKLSDVDEKDEEAETDEEKKAGDDVDEKKSENETETKKDETKNDKESEEKPVTSNKTDDKKIEEQKLEKTSENDTTTAKKEVESVAGTSQGAQTNGTIAKEGTSCNGPAGKSTDDANEDEDVNKEDDEEDPGRGIDLQVAWEVLELAKIVFTKRGEAGLKHLAETHRLLGEVAMESDNPNGAISDLESALNLLQKMEPCEPRAVAEIHYQLGLAHSLADDFDASIKQFGEATILLEARIKQLEEIKEPTKSDDPFYSVKGEIKELRELLPAIQEKITDMKDFKEEACRLVIIGIKNKVACGNNTNNAGPSHSDDPSSSSSSTVNSHTTVPPKTTKPASDISHLVRKKRKADEGEDQPQSPCKKPTP